MKKLHESWAIVWLAVGIIGGVVLGVVGRVNFLASGWFVMFAGILIVISIVRPLYLTMVLAVVAGFMLSFVRVTTELAGENYVRELGGRSVIVEGKIMNDPQSDFQKTSLKLGELKYGEENESVAGSIYVNLGRNEDLRRGDKIVVEGVVEQGFGTYVGSMYRPKLVKHLVQEPRDFVVAVRDWFAGRVREVVPEPEAGLSLSYLLGMKTGLSNELSENLRTVGLTHIVVASGAHLSILVEVARKIFGKVSRFSGVLFAGIFILFFMSVVGWTPSIMRAGIMALIALGLGFWGRKMAPWRMILLAAAITLLVNPMFVMDLGWLLSFASFIGIMMLAPKWTKFFFGGRKPGVFGETVVMTLAATAMTLPITLYYYGQISLISVVANLLILPTLPVAMGLTLATGVLGGVPLVGEAVSWCTKMMLDFHIGVVDFFGGMEQFLVKIEPYNGWVFALYAIIVIGLLMEKVVKLREVNNFGAKIMSGHSKWATTKRQKAVVDAKRGALFTKIGNQIAIAARAGTDPAMNPSLAMVLEKARLANMPKANIERAIARVADKSAAALIEEIYEAYGPGGVGIVIEVATDNKNRTMPEVRHTLDKTGGRMAEPGSVMFQFSRKGVIEISEKGDDAMMAALDAGAEDVSDEDDGTVIYTAASDLMKVRQALVDAGMTVTSAELQYVPNSYVPVEGENAEKLEKLLGAIDDLDDVVNTYTNAE